jgi:hypothetical protein
MVYCLDITYVLCYLARMMSDATESHTTRSWSIRLSDSSANCTQFWITARISLPATFDLRCPAHNYRRLLGDCHLVPSSTRVLLLFHLDPRKSVLTASSHLLLIKTYAFCVAGRSPKCSPSWLLASFRHLIRAISSTLPQSDNAHTAFRHSGIPYRHKGSDNFGKSVMPPTSQAENSKTSYVIHESRYTYMYILN